MPDTPTTALVRTATSPALARVSSQLALTDKLLAKPEDSFLIPYQKGEKWFFCDKFGNIVIDGVYEYPKFLDEHEPINWHVNYDLDGENENVWKRDFSHLQSNPFSIPREKYMVLRTGGRGLLLISTVDTVIGKGLSEGRETIIVGRRPNWEIIQFWWMRKPSGITINIGDTVSPENEYLIHKCVPRD